MADRRKTGSVFFSWATRKDGSSFTAIVRKGTTFDAPNESGSFVDFETVKEVPGIRTRVRAKGSAVRWRRWFIQQEAKAC